VGPALAGLVWHQPFAQVWYYIVAPLIGGAVAAAVFKFQSPDAD
jgi:glycerol uptake facilitator-like aquaporin